MKRVLSWIIGSVLLFGILSAFASTDTTQVKDTTSSPTETTAVETTQDELEIADEALDIVVEDESSETVTDTSENAPSGTYTNSAGNEVPSPYYSDTQPAGASALCRDGTYSFSQSRRGTCSHHGGVAEWL